MSERGGVGSFPAEFGVLVNNDVALSLANLANPSGFSRIALVLLAECSATIRTPGRVASRENVTEE